jgi:hypothetical protein
VKTHKVKTWFLKTLLSACNVRRYASTSKEGGDMLKAKAMFDMSVSAVGLKDFEVGPKPVSKMPSIPNPLEKLMGAK